MGGLLVECLLECVAGGLRNGCRSVGRSGDAGSAPSVSAASKSRVGSRNALNRLLCKVKNKTKNQKPSSGATGLGRSTCREGTEVKEHHRRRRKQSVTEEESPPDKVTEHQIQPISIFVSPPPHLPLALLL